ncbi:CDP-alcohol phosphatidyltransferase family protein [Clostridium cellulovorans]|uniref:CDP-alcohol phosphatidyltransferase n=1 Tax=Clostridium cellulovorans (strain ATCC 35296 / DSM 3052 / OCM 3 / 743B) TaxID=573061 RepID=D9SU10_CLOC7|nr:CDP-alcohol phosphatidyltransferase family protein [Clostridium cellulovorans]ADL50848.1 CDP-alcohol phosphatidyltransferase [Clostridium cellulovorans 743B]
MKSIPNTLSILRILISIILLFLKPTTTLFLLVYSVCGFTDIMDGYIARRTNSASNFGSKLDSLADIVFMGAVIVVFLPILLIPIKLLMWIIVIAFVRIASLLVVYFKYHAFAILHTYANKATGLSLFCFPYLYMAVDINILGFIICTIASVAAIEELVINITSKELSRDIKGVFKKP